MPSRKTEGPKRCRKMPSFGSLEYFERRERNNIAVQKSRQKTRQHTQGMSKRAEKLRTENEELERQVEILSKELCFLRDLFREVRLDNIREVPCTTASSVTSDEDELLPLEDSQVHFQDTKCTLVGRITMIDQQAQPSALEKEVIVYNNPDVVVHDVDADVVELDHKYSSTKFDIQLARSF